MSQYSVVAGKVHQNTLDAEPAFMQATLRYGFNNLITGYTGTIISDNYRAGLVGTGWNLPFGAVSFDVTHAKTTLQDRTSSGQSYRVSYSKFIDTTATNFTRRPIAIPLKAITASATRSIRAKGISA